MLLVIVLVNKAVVWRVVLSPVVAGLSTATQVYVVPVPTLSVNGILTVPPVQMATVSGLVIAGVGLTVTNIGVRLELLQPVAGYIDLA